MTQRLEVWGVTGLPEVEAGADLAALIVAAEASLADGDVLVVTSKVVSKAEGRLVPGTRGEHLAGETVRVVAVRGDTQIVETRHGFVLAAAGIDASNVPAGTVALLPLDPDASAARIRGGVARLAGVDVAVVVSDTMGRAWRNGVVDAAVGAAGLDVLVDLRGRRDTAGHLLEATVIAVADELAAAGDLVKGKLGSTPVAVVRGFSLQRNGSDAGARPLVRVAADDLFRLGTRESVLQAVAEAVPAGAVAGAVDVDVVRRAAAAVADGSRLAVGVDGRVDVPDDGSSTFELGMLVGRLLTALAGEGVRGQVERTATGVSVRPGALPAPPAATGS